MVAPSRWRRARAPRSPDPVFPRAGLGSTAPDRAPGGPGPPQLGVDDGRVNHRPEEDAMESIALLDRAGRRRSPATTSTFHRGVSPGNKGLRYPPDPPTVEEIGAVMRAAGDCPEGVRLRGVIVVLWRAGLRISEPLAGTHWPTAGEGSSNRRRQLARPYAGASDWWRRRRRSGTSTGRCKPRWSATLRCAPRRDWSPGTRGDRRGRGIRRLRRYRTMVE
jgi:hypothetical protein